MKWCVLGACLAASSCTIVALSDDVEQTGCLTFNDCEILNQRDREDFDRCHIFQCRNNRCVYTETDVDEDGFGLPICQPTGSISDCADLDPDQNPDHPELCDGKDNDCDLAIDEGMLEVAHTTPLVFPEPVRELGYSWNALGMELGVIYASGEGRRAGFAIVRPRRANQPGQLGLSRSTAPLRASGLNLGVRDGRFLGTATEIDVPHRIWVGGVAGNQSPYVLTVDDEPLRESGLRCAEGESCAPAQELPVEVPASTRPRLATLESLVLASYARRGEAASDGCESETPQPALLNLLTENFLELQETTSAAVRLGETRSLQAPALATIDAAAIPSATEQFGWLAAFSDADGALIVRRVRPAANELLGSLRLSIDPPSARYVNVQIGVGDVSRDRFEIGIVAQEGCGDEAHIRFGVLSLSWDLGGRPELRVYRELRRIGDEPGERPELVYNRVQASWGIAYVNAEGLFVRVLNRDGVGRGEMAYRVREVAPGVRDYAIVPSGEAAVGVFGVYSYVEGADQYSLDAAYLRACD